MISDRWQSLLISTYSIVNSIGLTRSGLGQRVFSFSYNLYKRFLEDPHTQLFKRYPHLVKGGHLIDVGANIGYVTVELSKVLTPGFKVFSFEPEANNFKFLNNSIKQLPNRDSIFLFQFAVGDTEREGNILVNKLHHGDHRLVNELIEGELKPEQLQSVRVVTLDSFLSSLNALQPIAFVKIDVQGNESLVLEGMKQLISTNREMSISLEITKDDMETVRSLNSVCGLEFSYFEISQNGFTVPVSREELGASNSQYRNILATRKLL
jgi:FkbM family methyltransferase